MKITYVGSLPQVKFKGQKINYGDVVEVSDEEAINLVVSKNFELTVQAKIAEPIKSKEPVRSKEPVKRIRKKGKEE
jgi:hypothetical protein